MKKTRWHDLATRTLSGIFLVAIALFALLYHKDSFTMLVIIGGIMALREWGKLCATFRHKYMAVLLGTILIGMCCASLIYLRFLGEKAPWLADMPYAIVLMLFILSSSMDISGFFFGRLIGGKKCWPSISPGKTWSGTIASFLTGMGALTFMFQPLQNDPSESALLLFFTILTFSVIAGDAFESWVKRKAGAKDSGTLIPGHGGVLDRIDGLLFSAPILALVFYFNLL